MGSATLKLFNCGPYKVRLLPSACARRHAQAHATAPGTASHILVRLCFGCDVGAAHEAGEDGAALFDVTATVSDEPPKGKRLRAPSSAIIGDRLCPCGKTFSPANRSVVYCDVKCTARPKPKGAKAARGPRKVVCRGCEVVFIVEGYREAGRRYCRKCRP